MADSKMASVDDSGPVDPRKFLRDLTEEEKAEYGSLRGTKRKANFRERYITQKLGKGSAVQTSSMSDRQENVTIGKYLNYWQMVQELGGLVNDPAAREFAMKLARRQCMACEKKGAPAIMWDKSTGVINYLLCKTGVNDVQTKAREQILNADMEMSDELIHKAMSDGEKLGFTAEIPESEKLKITNDEAGIAGLPALPSSTTGLTQTPMQQSGSTQLEAMMSLLKKITDPDGAAAEEKAREDAANAAAARQKAEGELAKERENTLAREKAEAKKAEEEKKAEEKKAEERRLAALKKKKTPEELKFIETNLMGARLNKLVDLGNCIYAQINHEELNDWSWAKDNKFAATLKKELTHVSEVVSTWNAILRCGTFPSMVKKYETMADLMKRLDDLKKEIEEAIEALTQAVGTLDSMNRAMLTKRDNAGKPKKPAGNANKLANKKKENEGPNPAPGSNPVPTDAFDPLPIKKEPDADS